MLMNKSILIDGKEYISAVRVAKKIGYASDYIGQLCRSGKIAGTLIGKTWYVDYPSIVNHKKTHRRGRKRKDALESSLSHDEMFVIDDVPRSESEYTEIAREHSHTALETGVRNIATLSLVVIIFSTITTSILWRESAISRHASFFYETVSDSLALNRRLAFVSAPLDWIREILKKDRPIDNGIAVRDNESTSSGIVVIPSSDDQLGIVMRIRRAFSDGVEISVDKENSSGVITPVFQTEESADNYAFVLVPIEEKTND
jgi:hypothetical protein